MVVFTCSVCGDAVKKKQVENHLLRCKSQMLSCVDCGKDFRGDAYKEHIKCITEEEKYSGKNFKPKPGASKGAAKQEVWMEKVQHVIDTVDCAPILKKLLNQMKTNNNVPRKKAKFTNFLKNSLRFKNEHVIDQAWELLMENVKMADETGEKESDSTEMQSPKKEKKKKQIVTDTNLNGDVGESEGKKKKKDRKRKIDESAEDMDVDNDSEQPSAKKKKFKSIECVLTLLKESSASELKVTTVKKKILAEYAAEMGEVTSPEKLWSSIEKRLSKHPSLKIHKDKVMWKK